jgi:hypothetical protein
MNVAFSGRIRKALLSAAVSLAAAIAGAAHVGAAPVPEDDELEVVRRILREISVQPSPLTRGDSSSLKAEDLPRFSAKAMSAYQEDRKDSAFRQAIVAARDRLGKQIASLTIMDVIHSGGDQAVVNERILEHQKKIAQAMTALREIGDELKSAGAQRDQEPSKRWQAHYDYLLARLHLQIAFLYEYQSALGMVRRNQLPELLLPSHNAWKLEQSEDENGDGAGKKLSIAARKELELIVKEHPDTPWSELAKRTLKQPGGLKWTSFEAK